MEIPELDIILHGAKMRGKKDALSWLQQVPAEYRGMIAQQYAAARRNVGTRSGLSSSSSSSDYSQHALPDQAHTQYLGISDGALKRHKPLPALPLTPLAIEPGPPPIIKTETIDLDDINVGPGSEGAGVATAGGTLEDMEHELINAAHRRKADAKKKKDDDKDGKKKDGDTKVVKTAAILKRPASSAIIKRPAASATQGIDMSDIFKGMRASFGNGISRSCFVDRAYKNGKARGLKRGMNAAASIEYAASQRRKAVELWNQLIASA